MAPNKPRIAIIGAGIAGLSLGVTLSAKSIPFTIYEARAANAIGHNYAITIHRHHWRRMIRHAVDGDDTLQKFRRATACDRLVGGNGRVDKNTKKTAMTFNAIDRDVRCFLADRLATKNAAVQWEHALESVRPCSDGKGIELKFGGERSEIADIVIDAGGLTAPMLKTLGIDRPQPRLLPYATYYGTRRMSSTEFEERYARRFQHATKLESLPDNKGQFYFSLTQVHLPAKDSGQGHMVEIRWVASRRAHEPQDDLFFPNRSKEEAKVVPAHLYDEIVREVRERYGGDRQKIWCDFFNMHDLQKDRILNWHLRVQIPNKQQLIEMEQQRSFQLYAIGDSAHGLPILNSRGAQLAVKDALMIGLWLEKYVQGDPKADQFLEGMSVLKRSVVGAADSLQHLKDIHAQFPLKEQELQDILGIDPDTFIAAFSSDSDSDSSSGPEADDMEDRKWSPMVTSM